MFDRVVEEFGRRVFLQAMSLLGNREDAEDATQEVFIRVHRSLDDFRGDAKMSTWIYTITHNVCLTFREARAGRKHAVLSEEGAIKDDDPRSNPAEQAEANDLSERLTRAIAKLPYHEGAAISLFYMGDKSYDEIAAILGMPRGSVATALHRGRARLQGILHNVMGENSI